MSSGQSGPPVVRKHLMTPGQPRPQRPEPMSLGVVQRWVVSTLAATTIMHLAVGVMLAAYFSDRMDAKIGLLVISAAFGIVAMETALIIHKHRLVSFWLLLGLVPALVGTYRGFGGARSVGRPKGGAPRQAPATCTEPPRPTGELTHLYAATSESLAAVGS